MQETSKCGMWVSVLALALVACGPLKNAGDADGMPGQDTADADSRRLELPGPNELLADLTGIAQDVLDVAELLGTREEECDSHYDCFDGWFSCKKGMMNASFAGPIPCWVDPNPSCEEYGEYWPCVSGECGEFELCQDDIGYLEALVPDAFEWGSGKFGLEIVDAQDWRTCLSSSCAWELLAGNDVVFHIAVAALGGQESQAVDQTTHLVAVNLSGNPHCKLELHGVPVEPVQATLIWAPLVEFVHTEGDDELWPRQGHSGALLATLADDTKVTIVWLWETYKARYAVYTVEPCPDGNCQPCVPSCEGDECGDDGCGGTCGLCEGGLECLTTEFGRRCTTACEPFTCPEGQLCLFGVCVDQECQTDDDCGGAPAHYCDKFLQCQKRTACQTPAGCKTWLKPHYCDLDAGFCMEDGNCWEDADCPGGTCGSDHWCFGHNCSLPDAPGCPPYMPICDMPTGDLPLCEGQTCGTCIAPCIFDAECPPGKECQGAYCNPPSNDCVLDADCAQGQYCHPGCVPLKPACESESDCAQADGKLCIAGFCGGPNEVVSCQDEAPCLAWREGYTCQGGVCKPEGACVLDSQCPTGQYCAGICLPVPALPECKTDSACAPGMICDNMKCQLPPECYFDSQCPAGHVCDDQHCYNDTGVCAWLVKGPDFCDDGDPCTTDACDAKTGCVHVSGDCP
jgi:hypothetical protein